MINKSLIKNDLTNELHCVSYIILF